MNKLTKYFKIFAVCLALIPQLASAQFDIKKVNLTADWQFNAPIGTDFTDKISGWGANFELSYSITPRWEAGVFFAYHSNHDYVERQTISLTPTQQLTTDQLRSSYQIPFGIASNYVLFDKNKHLKPYAGLKLGAMFSRYTTYYATSGVYDKGYGFYTSPEIGIQILPKADQKWGFHIAGYYSYATNQLITLTHEVNGQSNLGFRVGLRF